MAGALDPAHAETGVKASGMRIRISDPSHLPDLIEFLGRASCVAVHSKGRAVDVDLPHAPSGDQARRELGLYLAAWQGLHPGVQVDLGERSEDEEQVAEIVAGAFETAAATTL